jgi:hypothetical protein
MKGHNDDLVMSLAIGAWLYDANSEYSKSAVNLNTMMFSSMKRTTASTAGLLPGQTPNIYTSAQLGADARGDIRMVGDIKSGKMPQDLAWLFK